MKTKPLEGLPEDGTGRDPVRSYKEFIMRKSGSASLVIRPPAVSLHPNEKYVTFDVSAKDIKSNFWGNLLTGGWTFTDITRNDVINELVRLDCGKRPTGKKGILAFVAKYGPLWLDDKGEYSPPSCFSDGMIESSLWVKRGCEPVEQYFRWSRIAGALVAIAYHHQNPEKPEDPEPAPLEKMETLFDAYHGASLSSGDLTPIFTGPFAGFLGLDPDDDVSFRSFALKGERPPLATLPPQRSVLYALIQREFDRLGVAPRLSLGQRDDGSIDFVLLPSFGFLGKVLFDLAAVICGGRVIECCPYCGVVYLRNRRPKRGHQHFCPACKPHRKELGRPSSQNRQEPRRGLMG